MNNIINLLKIRGYIYQCNNIKKLYISCKNIITIYSGFDPTSQSLHIGNFILIMMLRYFQLYGHKVVILLGGITGKIGDPSGKKSKRDILKNFYIKNNIIMLKKNFILYLKFYDYNKSVILNNKKWLKKINYINFLKSFGKNFSMSKMLSFDSIKRRLKENKYLTFLSFNYILLQSYDFFYLYKKFNCILQIGGADQWINIISGVEIVKKKIKKEIFSLTSSLLTTLSKKKMGKTEAGAIWLNKNKYNIYRYWQFWRNVNDVKLLQYFYLFTDLKNKTINKYFVFFFTKINIIKMIIADKTTIFCHNQVDTMKIKKLSHLIFYCKTFSCNLPCYYIRKYDVLSLNLKLYNFILKIINLFSNTNAKKYILYNNIKLNNLMVTNINYIIFFNIFYNKILKFSIRKDKNILLILDK